jgi:hypothetical protein
VADQDIQQQVMEVLSDPMSLPPPFWDYMVQRWLADAPVFPISQVFGFTQFAAQTAVVATLESTTSTSYADLATAGPTLSALPDGKYVVVVAAAADASAAGVDCWMSYSVNGDSATDARGSRVATASIAGLSMFSTVSLSNNGSSTLTAKYRTSGGTSSFTNRCLFALKYGNL